ncbi:hypothetical protein CC1G_11112 [Coprinopsis cinerea okayama7|uniref:Uncharacterized protein n=1 Tax=Coprinopsis cinerea (strain Okayama-7 / 130 / ATCC MYA-4618 / FGSC 9003) TaxID=240176 RepID=A8P7Q6_COPC7|nr:hypothetical protein CC1G_11112 [Coprinopsis cinerea okayama7\|eukprot:XP_001839412.2 hypothetical protein CC1G_11112 [Coprinopsis cinerea okayama7\
MSELTRIPVVLPQELVYKILVHGAEDSTSFSLTLCRTSKFHYQEFFSHLYNTVVIKNLDGSRKLLESISNYAVEIYRVCTKISRFAAPMDNLYWLIHVSTSKSLTHGEWTTLDPINVANRPPLEVLILGSGNFRAQFSGLVSNNRSLMSPFWDNITKLWLTECDDDFREQGIIFDSFPNLTHFAVPITPAVSPLQPNDILAPFESLVQHPSLTHLVLVIYPDRLVPQERTDIIAALRKALRNEPKLLAVEFNYSDLQLVWDKRYGEKSIWEMAEAYTNRVKEI